jgi:hypothetical protein
MALPAMLKRLGQIDGTHLLENFFSPVVVVAALLFLASGTDTGA